MSYRSSAALAAAIAVLTIPAGASAATKTVAAGPPLTKAPPGLENAQADATQFFRETTTIHAGDTIRWKLFGFHSPRPTVMGQRSSRRPKSPSCWDGTSITARISDQPPTAQKLCAFPGHSCDSLRGKMA